jgi:hypothetical protein
MHSTVLRIGKSSLSDDSVARALHDNECVGRQCPALRDLGSTMVVLANHSWMENTVITFEIYERVYGEGRETIVREVQGTEVIILEGVLQIWDKSSSEEKARLVANVSLDRLITLTSSELVISWDGVDRRARIAPFWDGVDRRTSS